jgi:hypothetical protein
MKTLVRVERFNTSPGEAFSVIDDLGVTGAHMTESSAMMMGNKLNLTFLTPHHTGLGSQYRWNGSMMGINMDFTVKVTTWIDGKEKIWETVGPTKLIIYSWYRMHLLVVPHARGCQATLSITYQRPTEFLNKVLSFLFANIYCKWCLKKMLNDAKHVIERMHHELRVA